MNGPKHTFLCLAPLPQTAIEDYDEAIRLNPQYADAYYNKGVAYYYLGQQKLADRDFAKAKELGYDP